MKTKKSKIFDFSSITKSQHKAVRKMEQAEAEFIWNLERYVPPSIHSLNAKARLREAVKQCNAGILFHWEEENA